MSSIPPDAAREEGNKNLLKLADYLDTVPAESFDYNKYASDRCGTVACALGHACKIFPERLRLTAHRSRCWTPISFAGVSGFKAGNALFCLTEAEADCLFMPWDEFEAGADAKYVANKIRKFVEYRK